MHTVPRTNARASALIYSQAAIIVIKLYRAKYKFEEGEFFYPPCTLRMKLGLCSPLANSLAAAESNGRVAEGCRRNSGGKNLPRCVVLLFPFSFVPFRSRKTCSLMLYPPALILTSSYDSALFAITFLF